MNKTMENLLADGLLPESSWPYFRTAEVVMQPERLGAMHQTRLSFTRVIIRQILKQKWRIAKTAWQLSNEGFGHAIYAIQTPSNLYHLVIFSDEIADEERNDRVLAEKWDITFTLVQGELDPAKISQLKDNVPLQEAGRNTNISLVLARANKSVRLFEHVVASLASGAQPDANELIQVGYILRTTAVYGNGKFGIADFETLTENEDFYLSFSAQMCGVYILKQFSIDWVNFLAYQRNPQQAVLLAPRLQRYLGVGNATGLGMIPYLIQHPLVIDNWLSQRERALALVSSQAVSQIKAEGISALLQRALQYFTQIVTIDEKQQAKNCCIQAEIPLLLEKISAIQNTEAYWGDLVAQNQCYSLETQEVFISCLLEIYGEITDKFCTEMNVKEEFDSLVGLSLKDLKALLQNRYQWAIGIDFVSAARRHNFWYISENKQEPRLGVCGKDKGEAQARPLDIAYQVHKLYCAIKDLEPAQHLSDFLLEFPEYRGIARRVWTLGNRLLGEIQANVIDADFLPINLLRCKLSMFGATKYDPRSDLWVRVTFFQGAPLPSDTQEENWLFPILEDTSREPKDFQRLSGKMTCVTHNEVLVYCNRAFFAAKRRCGEADIIANMVVELIMAHLGSPLKRYVDLLQRLEQEDDQPKSITRESPTSFVMDLQNTSIACHLPVFLDYVWEHEPPTLGKRLLLTMQNGYNPWFCFSELEKLVKRGLSLYATWYDAIALQRVVYRTINQQGNLYLYDEPQPTGPRQLQIVLDEEYKLPVITPSHVKHVSHKEILAARYNAWNEGLLVTQKYWTIIQNEASKLLVPGAE